MISIPQLQALAAKKELLFHVHIATSGISCAVYTFRDFVCCEDDVESLEVALAKVSEALENYHE